MLHEFWSSSDEKLESKECLCKCYMSFGVAVMNGWSQRNVYVNVT
jgi:hypothetical protein